MHLLLTLAFKWVTVSAQLSFQFPPSFGYCLTIPDIFTSSLCCYLGLLHTAGLCCLTPNVKMTAAWWKAQWSQYCWSMSLQACLCQVMSSCMPLGMATVASFSLLTISVNQQTAKLLKENSQAHKTIWFLILCSEHCSKEQWDFHRTPCQKWRTQTSSCFALQMVWKKEVQ